MHFGFWAHVFSLWCDCIVCLTLNFQFREGCKVAFRQFCNFIVYITSLRMYNFRSWCLNAIAFKLVYFFNLFECIPQTIPLQIAKTNFRIIKGTTSTPAKLVVPPPTIAHYNGTQERHHVHLSKVGRHPPPKRARHPLNGTTSTPSKVGRQPHNTTIVPNGTTSTPPKLAVTLTIAPCTATASTPAKLVVSLPPTIAHYNGILQWHQQWPHVHYNNSTLHGTQWHHVHCTLQWHPAMAPRRLNHSTPQCHLQRHPAQAQRPLNHSTLHWHVQVTREWRIKVVFTLLAFNWVFHTKYCGISQVRGKPSSIGFPWAKVVKRSETWNCTHVRWITRAGHRGRAGSHAIIPEEEQCHPIYSAW